jgi:hypothetical protein
MVFVLVPDYVLRNLLILRHIIILIEKRYFFEKSVGVVIVFIKWAHYVGIFGAMSRLGGNVT